MGLPIRVQTGAQNVLSRPASTSVLPTPDPLDTKLPYRQFTKWDPIPDDDVPPLAVEVVGDWSTGKTHLSGTFPSPALCDTEFKGWMVWKKLGLDKYCKARDWGEVLAFFEHCIDDPEVKTLVFDSSKDVRDYAEQWTKGETGKQSLYAKGAGAVQFSMVYRKLDEIVHECRMKGKNVVFTARVKDEYVGESKTGRLVRDGYNKAPFQFDVVLYLRKGVETEAGKILYGKRIFGEVLKVGWLHYSRWPPYLLDISYSGIVSELVKGNWDGMAKGKDAFIEEKVRPLMVKEGVRE